MKKQDIIKIARTNAEDRLELITAVRDLIRNKPLMRTKIDEVDGNFLRKLYSFPGDLTSHRIATVLSKVK